MTEKVRSLYDYVMHYLKVEQLNKGIINLTGTNTLLIIIFDNPCGFDNFFLAYLLKSCLV